MAIPKNIKDTDTDGQDTQIHQHAMKLKPNAWQRRACGIGTKGYRVYDWALLETSQPDHYCMIRRSIDDGELAFYHCHNPNRAGFGELVNVAGSRWPIEECFGSSKNEVGLDEYQVRKYNAWHRHITLAMLTHSFLTITAHQAKKGGPVNTSAPRPPTEPTRTPHHQYTDDLSPSPSPKYADSSTSPATSNPPSPTD